MVGREDHVRAAVRRRARSHNFLSAVKLGQHAPEDVGVPSTTFPFWETGAPYGFVDEFVPEMTTGERREAIDAIVAMLRARAPGHNLAEAFQFGSADELFVLQTIARADPHVHLMRIDAAETADLVLAWVLAHPKEA